MTMGPEQSIAASPMHRRQVLAVATCIALNALDGFDVLAISFSAPGIATEWGITRAVLGVVLSVELIGMAIGSATLGNVADRYGRRPTILGCLCAMAIGMFAASQAHGIPSLAMARLLTGLGIGGMLSSTSAIVAETSNARRRGLNLSLNIAGYSAGAILGGSVASLILARTGNWRAVFLFGSVATLAMVPVAVWRLRESIGYLLGGRARNALARVNGVLRAYGQPPLEAMPAPRRAAVPAPVATLFSGRFRAATILLTVAYLAQIMVFYFIQKWVPKLVVDMGHTPAEAASVLVHANIGCLVGALAIGMASQFTRVVPLILVAMACAFACVAGIGSNPWSLEAMSWVCACAGFFVNAAVVGLYPVMAHAFPAEVRASGIGFAIGVGRGGASLGPMAAGALLSMGQPLSFVAPVMGSGALVAALMVFLLSRTDAFRTGGKTA